MKPIWVLEENVFSEKLYDKLLVDLAAEGNTFYTIKVIPFIHEIDSKTPDIPQGVPVVVYGSIGSQVVANKNGWKPGVWTSDAFSVTNYRDKLGSLFLNHDAKLCPIKSLDKITTQMPENDFVFIRPNLDTKEFAGEVIDRANLVTWYENMKRIGYLDENDFNIITATPKTILEEYRIVMVGGKIITWSTYKKYGKVYQTTTIKGGALAVAMQAASKFCPADVFVIDIAQTDTGYKVIEYNTFNSAGLYMCNTRKIVKAINDLYE